MHWFHLLSSSLTNARKKDFSHATNFFHNTVEVRCTKQTWFYRMSTDNSIYWSNKGKRLKSVTLWRFSTLSFKRVSTKWKSNFVSHLFSFANSSKYFVFRSISDCGRIQERSCRFANKNKTVFQWRSVQFVFVQHDEFGDCQVNQFAITHDRQIQTVQSTRWNLQQERQRFQTHRRLGTHRDVSVDERHSCRRPFQINFQKNETREWQTETQTVDNFRQRKIRKFEHEEKKTWKERNWKRTVNDSHETTMVLMPSQQSPNYIDRFTFSINFCFEMRMTHIREMFQKLRREMSTGRFWNIHTRVVVSTTLWRERFDVHKKTM